jgi:PTS system nitrogen regulatory IIA component
MSGNLGGPALENKWMKVKEVAAYLQISKDLIYKWAQEGKIPVSKIGNQWRFTREEVDEWAKAQRPRRKKT